MNGEVGVVLQRSFASLFPEDGSNDAVIRTDYDTPLTTDTVVVGRLETGGTRPGPFVFQASGHEPRIAGRPPPHIASRIAAAHRAERLQKRRANGHGGAGTAAQSGPDGAPARRPLAEDSAACPASRKRKKSTRATVVGNVGVLEPAERKGLSKRHKASQRPNTRDTYASRCTKWAHFKQFDEAGKQRPEPLPDDITTEAGLGNVTRFLEWGSTNWQGWKPKKGGRKADKLNVGLFKGTCSALEDEFKHQLLEKGKAAADTGAKTLREHPDIRSVIVSTQNELAEKGQRADHGEDPQKHTAQANSYTTEQLYRMACTLGSSKSTKDARTLAILLFLHSSLCRSDSARLICVSDLCHPREFKCVGPMPCFLWSAVLQGGKVQEGGRVDYTGFIRARVAEVCPARGVAMYLALLYTIDGAVPPDPRSIDWSKLALFPGVNKLANVSYDALYTALKDVFREHNVDIKKITHAGRAGGSAAMDNAGCSIEMVQRLGKWLADPMFKSYLQFFDIKGLLAIGDWPEAANGNTHMFWQPRYHMAVSDRLVTLVYSFLPETREIVASMGPAASVSARAWPKVLESFGILLVQDSLDLAERQPENKIHAMLLADDEFQALKQLYEEKLAAGAFEVIRPRTSAESDGEIRAMLRSLAADMADMRSNMRVHQDEVLALVRDQGRFVQPRLTNVSEAEDLAQQPRLEDILAAENEQEALLGGEDAAGSALGGDDAAGSPPAHPDPAEAPSSSAALQELHADAQATATAAPASAPAAEQPAVSRPDRQALLLQTMHASQPVSTPEPDHAAAVRARIFTPPEKMDLAGPFRSIMPAEPAQAGQPVRFSGPQRTYPTAWYDQEQRRYRTDSLPPDWQTQKLAHKQPPAALSPTSLAHGFVSALATLGYQLPPAAPQPAALQPTALQPPAGMTATALAIAAPQQAPAFVQAVTHVNGLAMLGVERTGAPMQAATTSSQVVLPALTSMDSVVEFWDVWTKGSVGAAPLQDLAEDNTWRKGKKNEVLRKRWSELHSFAGLVYQRVAQQSLSSPTKVVQALDAERDGGPLRKFVLDQIKAHAAAKGTSNPKKGRRKQPAA